MRLYAESNFVLELILEQEQHEACERLVQLAHTTVLQLCIPAFALAEPFATLKGRSKERRDLSRKVAVQLDQVRRSPSLARDVEAASGLVAELLVKSMQAAEARYRSELARLLSVAVVLPLTAETLARADDLAFDYGLELPDAIVLASVLLDPALGSVDSCFANRNTKDFDDPSIVDLLRERSCRYIGNFEHALAHVTNKVSAG